MISYADFDQNPAKRRRAMEVGIHASLGIPPTIRMFLDNGAFYFLNRAGRFSEPDYQAFVVEAKPDWWPIPRDYIPTPHMTSDEHQQCLSQTMAANRGRSCGSVPVIHVSPVLCQYIDAMRAEPNLCAPSALALGGIVPNLLRAPKAQPYTVTLDGLLSVRMAFPHADLHVFGVGGTATLHLMALLEIDSADSSGWRNRAARGIVQMPGTGDRMVASLGSWRGREPSEKEWKALKQCSCQPCQVNGLPGLQASGVPGFRHRATHNLSVLLGEATAISNHLSNGSYQSWYLDHLDNSTYTPLIRQLVTRNARAKHDDH